MVYPTKKELGPNSPWYLTYENGAKRGSLGWGGVRVQKIAKSRISRNWLGVSPELVRNTPHNLGMGYLTKKELGPNSPRYSSYKSVNTVEGTWRVRT